MAADYAIDRQDPPQKFYTLKADGAPRYLKAGVDVLVESGQHPQSDMLLLGQVTRQTPYGQGWNRAFYRNELREATPDEVRAALDCNHNDGPDFVPEMTLGMGRAKYWLTKKRWLAIATRQRERILMALLGRR